MGNWRASKFFKSLLGFKTTDSPQDNNKQLKRRWSLVKSRRRNSCPADLHEGSKPTIETSIHPHRNSYKNEEPNKHAVALAAATAAAVEAAITAAHAAAEIVRMTTGYGGREELAAVKIQSCFRAYLARRALRALKALVKLQAVVRGHLLRKQTVDMMRRLQALVRAQERASAMRSRITDSTTNPDPSSQFHHYGLLTPEKVENFPHGKHDYHSISKRTGSRSYVRGINGQERMFLDGSSDHEDDKVVEVDMGGSYVMTKGRRLFQHDQSNLGHSPSLTTSRGSTLQPTSSSPFTSCEVNSFYNSTRGEVTTPIKSDGSRSSIGSYSNHPNYMANTESSRAKLRSLSAPKLRPQLDVSNVTKRYSGYKYASGMQQVPKVRDSLVKKTYLGSGRHDQHVLLVYDKEESDFCADYWN
ncbi:hypothetical protein QVD17_28267 [Tagetes erecta]|uniref:DUF4005 domain-containing protein n=1 Tax=Tagetes erecta TaxID=13708 RepID=A0AAD8KA37_TARER|nr:hypothetical protein QVD17_28267 [Tagetes erecta]